MFNESNKSTSALFDVDVDLSFKTPNVLEILIIVLQVSLFCVGLHFQVRTILVCIEEKNKTWQLHIAHSIVMTIFYGYNIPFYAISYFIPSLGTYVGNWICYLSVFLGLFAFQAMVVHSLLIAIQKYIFICHTWKARLFGEERIQRIFLVICITYPVIMAILTILLARNWIDNRSEIKSCFGKSFYSSSSSDIEQSFFCDGKISADSTALSVYGAKALCVTRSVLNTIINTNIPEGIFYFMIFRQMKR